MVDNETLKIIRRRRSIRSYRDEQIKDEELQAILETGLYAPNAGDQAWHFTVIQNKEILDRLNTAAKEAAKLRDMPHLRALGNNGQFNCLYHAPTLVIVSGNGKSPMPLDMDCAAATENMLLAAESLGIGSCWIFFVLMAFDTPQGRKLMKELKIPEGYRPYDAAVFGYKKTATPQAPARKSELITYIK